VRSGQVPFVIASRRVRKAADVERSLVSEEVRRPLGLRLVGKVVLPEAVDLIGRHRLVLRPVEVAWRLVRQVHPACSKQVYKF